MAVPDIALRSAGGVALVAGPDSYAPRDAPRSASTQCRAMAFSPDGELFAFAAGATIELHRRDRAGGDAWRPHRTYAGPKALELQFSPRGEHLACWEHYSAKGGSAEGGAPNMHVYSTKGGADAATPLESFVQIKQQSWRPEWSSDEALFARLVNAEVHMFEAPAFKQPAAKLSGAKVAAYTLSPAPKGKALLFCHLPGSANLPSFGKMFRYPNLDVNQAIASKGFFQGESAQFFWNERGTSVLFMMSSESDKNGTTYYGRQTLHYADSKGETSLVQLGKEGPIYDVAWHPRGREFCVVYGTMPARATLYNLKCDPVYEFGEGPRNSIFYSPNGARLLLCGFGNLPGRMEIWDAEAKKQLQKCEAPDSTGLVWDPRSECFVTFTTAPRLRIDNGYKVWHNSGALMHEYKWPSGELYEVLWQPGNFPASALSTKKPKSIAPSKPALSKQPYRPPAAQGKESSFKVHDEDEKPHFPGQSVGEGGPSKAALKQKKKREARKAKKAEEQNSSGGATAPAPATAPSADGSDEEPVKKPPAKSNEHKARKASTNDPDKDKKIKNIIKKLEAIDKLKSEVGAGKALDPNQLAKIAKENDLLKELGELNL